jgi:aminoglycoside phosphotransferase (APT) family kinase protein
MRAPPAADIGSDLLAYLRAAAGDDIAFSEPPVRLGGGVESRVYGFRLTGGPGGFAGPLVLKVFGGEPEPQRALIESVVCNTVAGMGFPAPRVLHTCTDAGVFGASFMIMERLPGRVMLEAATGTRPRPAQIAALVVSALFRAPRVVGATTARLHALDAEVLRRALEAAGIDMAKLSLDARLAGLRDRIEETPLGGQAQAARWLEDHRPGAAAQPAICHGDLWPGNILEADGRVTGVLDWTYSLTHIGNPEYDLGVTTMTLGLGVPDLPRPLLPIIRRVQPRIAERVLKEYAARMPLDRAALHYYQMLRCVEFLEWVARRRVNPALRPRDEPDLLDIPEQPTGFIAHFRRGTGIALDVPAPSGG